MFKAVKEMVRSDICENDALWPPLKRCAVCGEQKCQELRPVTPANSSSIVNCLFHFNLVFSQVHCFLFSNVCKCKQNLTVTVMLPKTPERS